MNVLCRLVNVIPLAPGADGEPVPSVQESFCIHESASDPAAGVLKIALFAGAAVSCKLTD